MTFGSEIGATAMLEIRRELALKAKERTAPPLTSGLVGLSSQSFSTPIHGENPVSQSHQSHCRMLCAEPQCLRLTL